MTDWIQQKFDELASLERERQQVGKLFIAKLRQQLLSDLERFKEIIYWVRDVEVSEYNRYWRQLRIQVTSKSGVEQHLFVELPFGLYDELHTLYVRRHEHDEHPYEHPLRISLKTKSSEITKVSREILDSWFSELWWNGDLGEKKDAG